MDKWLLKLVRLFNPVFKKQGIDTTRLYAIVETKLMMDKRRVYMHWKQRQQDENRNHLAIILGVYSLFGIFTGIMIMIVPSIIVSMALVHGYIIFMMAMTLITDFSSVLLDTTDNQVILPRPVNSKTLFMARLVHIMVYLLQFTIALSIAPLICTVIKYGVLTGFVFCFTSGLSVLLAVFLTYLLYLLILRFSNEEKIKDIITYLQIFLTIFFVVGYQVIPRMNIISDIGNNFQLHAYYYLLPPFWMALTLEAVHDLNFDAIHLLMIALAILVPVLFFWILTRFLAPSFARKLSALNTDGVQTKKTAIGEKQSKGISTVLSALACNTATERSAFEIVWKITGREKSFRLQFYPSLAYIAVFIFIFVFKTGNNVAATWNSLPGGNGFLWFIYLPMFAVSSSIMIVAFNENYQASWIYHSLPIAKPGQLISGCIKSLFVKYFLPIYLFCFIFCLKVWGWNIIDDFVFGLLNNAVCFLSFTLVAEYYLPFSRQPNTQQQTGRIVIVILQLILVGIFVGLHYLLVKRELILYILLPFIAAGCWLLVNKLRNIPWKKIAV
jgi:ABC-2 type transport system permease protein